MRAPISACATGASTSITTPGKMPASRQSAAKHEHRGEREAIDLARLRRPRVRGRPRKRDAERLDEAGGGQRGGQRQQRAVGRDRDLQAPLRQVGMQQDGLEGQPLGDEAVQRRQGGDRDAADQEGERGLRHAVDQAAEMLHVALAGGGQHRAGAEEQQALEHRVVEHVEQRRGQRQRRAGGQPVGAERQRQAEADEDDADVLDRVVGEQPLQVVLHQRVEHAEHRGDAAERQHDDAGPPGRRAQQVEDDADEAVDRDLGHHPAHQRGDVARRGGMRQRQPDVQRHQAGLRSGADQRQHQHERGDARRRVRGAHRGEGVAAGGAGQQAEAQQQRQAGEARHHEIDVAGAGVAALAVVRHHQRPGGERHQLPGEQEAEGVVGDAPRGSGRRGRPDRTAARAAARASWRP